MGKLTAIKTKSVFQSLLNNSEISEQAIHFILDTGLIYTHGIYINGAAYGTEANGAINLSIAGVTKALSLSAHTHSTYLEKNSNIDLGSYIIKSGNNELLKWASNKLILGSPTYITGTAHTTRNSTNYDILDTGNFSVVAKTSTNISLQNVATIKYGSSSFLIDYAKRINGAYTFDNITYTSIGTTNVNNQQYGIITMYTDGSTPASYALIRADIPNGKLEYRTSGSTAWKTIVTGALPTVFVGSGSNHASGLVPDPGATAGTAKFLCEDGTWKTPTYTSDTNTWRNILVNGTLKLSTAINSGGLDIINGTNTTVEWTSGNKLKINSVNTWNANAVGVAGYVAAPTKAANANMTWQTDAEGVPAWRASNNHSHSYLPLSGGTMTGDITFSGDNYISWSRNTDGASISFVNTGDGDTNSYMHFLTSDNGNEYFRFSHTSGGTNTEWMTIKSDGVRVKGTLVSLNGHTHNDLYVSSLTTSGNSLRWVKNGSNNDITIPYATNADMVDNVHLESILTYKNSIGNQTQNDHNFHSALKLGVYEMIWGGYIANHPSDWEDGSNHFGQMLHFGNASNNHGYILLDRATQNIYFKNMATTSTYGEWYKVAHSGNSSVTKSGETLTVKINGTSQSLTNTWRGIQDNLTSSSSTTESLSAKQGYLLANGSARDNTKLPLSGGTMVGTISAANDAYGGGGFNNGYANIILRGNTTTGTSGIVFSSSKGDTSINRPSDCAFIQFLPYGVSAATAVGTNPTINTSGESGRFVIGIHNDSGDLLWLQTSAVNDLKHVVGANVYTIYDSGNLPAYPTKASWNYDDRYVSSVALSGNYLRITKNGANTDLTIPYATNASLASTASRLETYTETSNNTNVYRVIGQQTLNAGWVNKGLVLAVASRHSGVGIYVIHYGAEISNGYYAANNQSYTDNYYTFGNVYCTIRYFGDTTDTNGDKIICHVKPASGDKPTSAVFTFFLHSNDGSSPRISILQDWGTPFTLVTNGATMSSVDTSTYGELKAKTVMNESNSCTGNAATATNADTVDGAHLAGFGGTSGVMRSWGRGAYTSANRYFGNGNVVTIDPIGTGCRSANDTILSLGDNGNRNTQLLVSWDSDGLFYRRITDTANYGSWKRLAFLTDNVASATKLQNARTLWGQSFDGSANVSGFMLNVSGLIYGNTLGDDWSDGVNTHPWYGIDYRHCIDSTDAGKAYTSISSYFGLYFKVGAGKFIFDGGNVGIGTTGPSYKLHVNGSINGTSIYLNGTALSTASTHAHGDYVTAIGTSGNTLTWSKGGIAQTAITVPYATSAGYLTDFTRVSRVSKNSDNTEIESVSGWKTAGFILIQKFCPPTMYRTTEDAPAPYGIGFGNGSESGGIMPIGLGDKLEEIRFYGANSGPTIFTFGRQLWEDSSYDTRKSNKYITYLSINSTNGNLTTSGTITAPTFVGNLTGSASTLGTYAESAFLRYRAATNVNGEATLWSQLGLKQYNGALPDSLSGTYNWGQVVSFATQNARFEIYASHQSSNPSNGANGLYYRTGWDNDKREWTRFLDSNNSSVSKSGETISIKINNVTQTLTNTTYSAGKGLRLSGTTFISDAPRVAKDSKVFGGQNTWIMEEYNHGTAYNLPSDAWYHIMSTQGADTAYGTLLALGMTTEGVYYRCYNGGSWGSWKSLINTNTTYSANNGVGLSGTTFYNSGVRAATINGNYLRVNTNGTNADLTIPYATSAGSASSVGGLAIKKFGIGATNDDNVNHYYLVLSFTSTGLYSSWSIKLHVMCRTEGGEALDYYVLIGGEYSSATSVLGGITAYTLDNYQISGDHWYYNTSNGVTNVYFYQRETWKNYTCTVVDYSNSSFTISNAKLNSAPTGLVAFAHRLNITSLNISSQSVNYATSAGSANAVAWDKVSSKPATATRWPTWSEVTSKPTVLSQGSTNVHDNTAGLLCMTVSNPASGDVVAGKYGSVLQWANNPGQTPSTVNSGNWYNQLFGLTDDRLYFRTRTNGSNWTSLHKIAWTSDIPTNVSQLTNDSGYITGISYSMVVNALGDSVQNFAFNLGGGNVGWVNIARLPLSTYGAQDAQSFDLYVGRYYNSPNSEAFTCNISTGWGVGNIKVTNRVAPYPIVEYVRIAQDSNYRYVQLYVNTRYTTYPNYTNARIIGCTLHWEGMNEVASGSYTEICSASLTSTAGYAYQGADNNFINHTNEFNFVPSSFGGYIYINYRTASGSNGSIDKYLFCNGAGGALAVLDNNNGGTILTNNNVKTINGQSIFGSGDITASGGGGGGGNYLPIAGGTMTGLLNINTYGNTVTIGSQNNDWCHIYNSADIPFIFNRTIWTMGDLIPYNYNGSYSIGTSGFRWSNIYADKGNFSNTLHVEGTIYSGGDFTCNGGDITINEPASGGAAAIWFQSSGTTKGNLRVKADGALYFYTGTGAETTGGSVYAGNFYTTSDIRKKDNIKPISKLLPIYEFDWKSDGSKSYGFIAQWLELTNPELVSGEDYKHVNYNATLALYLAKLSNIVEETKEDLYAKIAKLETRIKELETSSKLGGR